MTKCEWPSQPREYEEVMYYVGRVGINLGPSLLFGYDSIKQGMGVDGLIVAFKIK